MPLLASDPARNEQLGHLRDSHPVFRVEDARAAVDGGTLRLEFRFTRGETAFAPSVAIVEAFSYWKAFCSPVIEVALPPVDPAEISWWESFWPKAMGEFLYRNGIEFTSPGFLSITTRPGLAPAAEPARPVTGRRRQDHRGPPPGTARAAGPERLRPPQRAHPLLGLPSARSAAGRLLAGQPHGAGRQLAQRRRAERVQRFRRASAPPELLTWRD